ncbi:MAG: cellulase family glycosylhydrolase [Paludibacteraceae bacterium]|nr:cellulase family glycosylhydrolase [Paludibacteraceae bacterium]
MKKFFSLLAAATLALSMTAGEQDNYIQQYGRLKLNGKQLSDENGNAVQLRGWSSFGWMNNWGDCHQKGHLQQMKRWGASIYRGAMYVEEGGYNSNQSGFTQQTKTFIDQTAELGMYYLCDWHVLSPGNPNDNAYRDAENYFREISSYVKSKGYKHVLYEICNEPNGCSWNDIKSYAQKVLPIIQQNDPGACVVVGTPQWDQLIDQAQNDQIQGYNNLNLLYSFHYYSCSHQQFLSKLENAARSIPVFISEWGIANFDGGVQQGRNVDQSCISSAESLMRIADGSAGQKISWCAWSFGEKAEQASSLMSCGSMELSTTGKKIVEFLGCSGDCFEPIVTSCYAGTCQPVPGIVDLGMYDENPDGGKEDMGFGKVGSTYVGGGEGVTYHEENTTDDEVNDGSLCNGAFKWGGEGFSFRQNECVDASNCYGINNDEGWHNLGYIEPGEWIVITLDVQEPGYYSVKALCNPTTNQYIGMGSVSHSCNLIVDINTDEDLAGMAFVSEHSAFNTADWDSWKWYSPVSDLDDQDDGDNIAVLFKEAGEHTIKISFMTGIDVDAAGDLGPLEFTKVKAYTGPGYPSVNVNDAPALSSDLIYPNPSNGIFSVATAGELTIVNLVGEVVFSANVEANKEINSGLKAGNYIATVKSAEGVKVAKITIK